MLRIEHGVDWTSAELLNTVQMTIIAIDVCKVKDAKLRGAIRLGICREKESWA